LSEFFEGDANLKPQSKPVVPRKKFVVYIMDTDETIAWFICTSQGSNEQSAIDKSRVQIKKPGYKVCAFIEGSAEAKAAHRKVGRKIPAGVR